MTSPLRAWKLYRAYAALESAWETMMITKEPVALGGVIRAAIYLGSLFGLHLTPEQMGALVVVGELILTPLIRSRVSPVRKS